MRMLALGPALAVVLLATSVQAENVRGRGDPAGYIAGAGFIALDDDLSTDTSPGYNGGANLRMGFRLDAPFAFELQGDYNHLKAWRRNDLWDITMNFRVYPVQYFLEDDDSFDLVQPYVVGGVGVIGGDPRGDKYQINGAFRTGLGLDVYVTEQVALSLGYEWVTGTGFWAERDTRNIMLGVQINFGSDD